MAHISDPTDPHYDRPLPGEEYHCHYCGTCHHEEAWWGEPPDEYEFICNCDREEN